MELWFNDLTSGPTLDFTLSREIAQSLNHALISHLEFGSEGIHGQRICGLGEQMQEARRQGIHRESERFPLDRAITVSGGRMSVLATRFLSKKASIYKLYILGKWMYA